MSKNQNQSTRGGVGFGGLLIITFIVLKLTKVIDWSWFWVLAPAWIPLSLLGVILLLLGLVTYLESKKN